MTGQWFFHTTAAGDIVLRARFEGDEGMVGDADEILRPGDTFHGVSFDALKAAGAGCLRLDDARGRWAIEP
jgi:hypothetical protein